MSKNNKKSKKSKKSKKILHKNPVWKGITFLCKSVYSQWKVLFTITIIFFILIFVLSGITFALEEIGNTPHFSGDGLENGEFDYFDSLWWVFVTISTVGYGDIYPITTFMRVWAMLIGIIGIAFLALYTAVVVNGFAQELQRRKNSAKEKIVISKVNDEMNTELVQLRKELAQLREENLKFENSIKRLRKQNKNLKDDFKK
ncbi:MAG: hypothetical protein TYPL_3200 [Candidatus Tyloplasma litorale]|nr:MAG: hypothetical protein TYPL_3200 [Mycoplasmatales bacterium]